jgi:hypothetical protein
MPSLGQTIRAHRMGYGWTGTCWLRIITGDGPGPIRCDVHPDGLLPNSMKNHLQYRVWWEGESIIKDFPLARVKAKRPFTVYVDDNGNIV